MDLSNIKPNSHTYKEQSNKPKTAIVSGASLAEEKKPKATIADHMKAILMDSVENIIVPLFMEATDNAICDISNSIFNPAKRRISSVSGSRLGYHNRSAKPQPKTTQPTTTAASKNSTVAPGYQEVVVRDVGEANRLVIYINDLIVSGGAARIADLYEAAGVTGHCGNYTLNSYGWDTPIEGGVNTSRTGDGQYILHLPYPKPINQ